MGILSKLFGSKKHVSKVPSQQEVIVYFSYGSTNFQHLYSLEDSLRIAISEAKAGEYDGHEVATDGSDGAYYMFGPDAEALYKVISPVLAASPFMRGAKVSLLFGPQKRRTPKRVIQLP